MKLNLLRKNIDQIDSELLKLLAERLRKCKELSKYKKKNNLPIQNKEREQQVIKERAQKFKELGFDDGEFIRDLFELIMKKSREAQE